LRATPGAYQPQSLSQMVFQESNNRDVARKYAEYITSVPLRRFVAEKVREYCGDLPLSIFDGACGSGQLEQFLTVGSLYAVDIQASPLLHIPDNFPDATVKTVNENFFNAIDDVSDTDTFDCVIMNPPFSLQYKAQSADIREKISAMMPYKKTSGVLDDAFYVLASMKARFSFFLCFPGVGYRRGELAMRQYFGNRVVELVQISGGFADTSVSVLFVIIDNEKQSDDVVVYGVGFNGETCKKSAPVTEKINTDNWNRPYIAEEKEVIDIVQVTAELLVRQTRRRKLEDEHNAFVWSLMSDDQRTEVSRFLSVHGLFFDAGSGCVHIR
ncbi:TPA: hypothetical protein ACWCB6_005734, partial [Escherichia coli]